jgi:glycosyltransferase involved in cell wall biosynthesis
MCSWATTLLPNSEAEANLVVDGLGAARSKTHMVPNGVDKRFLNADPTPFIKKYGVKDFILNVGHVGQERKNVLALIQALGQIDHPAVIIGRVFEGRYGEACVNEAKKYKHILLLDRLDNDSELLASAYAACKVFALPSLFETPGIAALEAGLAGAKVVITPYGGPKEYFGELAEYVEPRSVDSIRSGIMKALNAQKDDRLQEHIRREFLWQRVAEMTADAYRLTLAR